MCYVGKEWIAVEKNKEYKGRCTSIRTVSKGVQAFLEIPGRAGRYFFTDDLIAPRLMAPKKPVVKRKKKSGSPPN